MSTLAPLAAGTRVRIVKGCAARSVAKNGTAQIVSVTPLGADCGHSVRVVLSYAGRTLVFFARHPNRLADAVVRLNDGNPLHTVEIVRGSGT
jgi:hypothetical protein